MGPASLTTCESTYCRLSSTKLFSDSWRPQAGLESRHDGIRSSPRCKTFQFFDEICRKRSHHSYADAGFHLKNLYKYYNIFFLKSQKLFKKIGGVGFEPTHPGGTGFTVRRRSPTRPPAKEYLITPGGRHFLFSKYS